MPVFYSALHQSVRQLARQAGSEEVGEGTTGRGGSFRLGDKLGRKGERKANGV